ncbi:hypothetical protein [Aeromicrobium sp.]|jgi:hypothetical protein|uniref:hypothetical protein n=1 Tax=Aeromicrobium sp. TaxID=1871063 RepID=UPI0025C70196|nr:hypothetical protein [Aeromicrobium sp.]MCK5890257.1 hypothetical protein [Aeromicrobium sp.]
MGRSIRQQARLTALQAQASRRRERAAADKRRSDLGIEVAVALQERDELTRRLEVAAGQALVRLMCDEGVTLTALEEWVPDLSAREVKRLRAIAEDHNRTSSSSAEAET